MQKSYLLICCILIITTIISCEKSEEKAASEIANTDQKLEISSIKECEEASNEILKNLTDTSFLSKYRNTLGEYTRTKQYVNGMLYSCDWNQRKQELVAVDSTNIRAAFVYDMQMNCNNLTVTLIFDRLGTPPGLQEFRISKPLQKKR